MNSSTRPTASISAQEIIGHGKSAATVMRISQIGRPPVYRKSAPLSPGGVLHNEKLRYEWLLGRVPVPSVLGYDVTTAEEVLLLSEVPGLPAFDRSLDPTEVVKRLAEGLQLLHAIPIDQCPFDMRLDVKIAMARANAEAGRVDLDDLQSEHKGWTAQMLLDEVERTRPSSEDLVVAHGDYCLPNVILSEDASRISGFIDIGYLGVADRYQDLALAWRSIRFNLGEQYVQSFFDAYGMTVPDRDRIAFNNLLDELF